MGTVLGTAGVKSVKDTVVVWPINIAIPSWPLSKLSGCYHSWITWCFISVSTEDRHTQSASLRHEKGIPSVSIQLKFPSK